MVLAKRGRFSRAAIPLLCPPTWRSHVNSGDTMAHTRRIVGAGALLIGSVTLALPLQAQPIYRCANSYSQTPCPGSVTLDVQDSRSPAQKAQSEAATIQAVRLANEMEKERLKGALVAGKNAKAPTASTTSAQAKGAAVKQRSKQKNTQPGPFVAFAPAQEKPGAKKSEVATTKP